MEVGGLADVVDVYVERQCAIDSYPEASDIGRWLDADGLEVKCACKARFRALLPITMASVLSWFIDKPLR